MPSETVTVPANSPAEKPQASQDAAGSTSKETPVTFTKEQVDKAVRDAKAELGRQHKADVETAVSKAREEQSATIKEHADRISELEEALDDAVKDDADKSDILKLKRQLRGEIADKAKAVKQAEDTLKAEKEAHDKEWTAKLEKVKWAELKEFARTAEKIANEYDGGDADKLKGLCEDAEKLTEDFARKTAARLWTKKSEVKKPLVEGTPDPGGTAGGANSYESLRDAWLKDQHDHPTNPDAKLDAQYKEARRKKGIQ